MARISCFCEIVASRPNAAIRRDGTVRKPSWCGPHPGLDPGEDTVDGMSRREDLQSRRARLVLPHIDFTKAGDKGYDRHKKVTLESVYMDGYSREKLKRDGRDLKNQLCEDFFYFPVGRIQVVRVHCAHTLNMCWRDKANRSRPVGPGQDSAGLRSC